MNDLTQQLARQHNKEVSSTVVCNTLLPSVNLYLDRIEFIIRLAIESSPTSSIAVQFYEAAGIVFVSIESS